MNSLESLRVVAGTAKLTGGRHRGPSRFPVRSLSFSPGWSGIKPLRRHARPGYRPAPNSFVTSRHLESDALKDLGFLACISLYTMAPLSRVASASAESGFPPISQLQNRRLNGRVIILKILRFDGLFPLRCTSHGESATEEGDYYGKTRIGSGELGPKGPPTAQRFHHQGETPRVFDSSESFVQASVPMRQLVGGKASLGACPGISIQVTSMDDQSVQLASIRPQCSFAPIPAA
jgi:hypothetical protein